MLKVLATNQDTKSRAGGFAFVYTILIISIATGLSGIILSSQTRQTKLTTTANESTRAFYSADVGYECTLYQDRVNDRFENCSNPPNFDCAESEVKNLSCDSGGASSDDRPDNGDRYTFSIRGSDERKCADVIVDKYDATADDPEKTVIISSGFDDCDNRQVERVLSTSY